MAAGESGERGVNVARPVEEGSIRGRVHVIALHLRTAAKIVKGHFDRDALVTEMTAQVWSSRYYASEMNWTNIELLWVTLIFLDQLAIETMEKDDRVQRYFIIFILCLM